MSHPANRGKRLLAATGVLALGLTGMLAGSAAAQAAPLPGPGNIDTTVTDGSITIHKHETATGAGEGDPQTGTPGTGFGAAIAGVEFTVYPITGLDLTSPAGWDVVEQLGTDVAGDGTCTVPAPYALGAGQPVVTDGAGVATASGLSVAAYLVCETAGPANITTKAAPFVVTIPFPHDGDWLYNPHVFPKNSINTVVKEVQAPSGLGIGSTVNFPVSTAIQPLPAGQTYTSFQITDTLDDRLTPVSVASVTIDGVDVTDQVTIGGTGQFLTVELGAALANANIDNDVVVTFQGTVATLGDGVIENTATVFVNDPDRNGEGIPSNEVATKWGDLIVSKVDADDADAGLAGAIFEVYASDDPYAADCSTTSYTGSAISVGAAPGQTRFTTTNGGKITVPGLWITDTDNDPAQGATERCYFVKEVQAPTGFVTPGEADAYTPVAVTVGQTTVAYDVQIENDKQTVPNLPLTGGAGQTALLVGGLVLLSAGTVLFLVRRRKMAAGA